MSTTDGTTSVRVTMTSAKTLRQLSDVSKIPIQELISTWTASLQKALDKLENPSRVSFYSDLHSKSSEHDCLVLTRIARLVVNSFPLTNSETEEDALEKVKAK
jgi:hypothetical protein